MRRVFSQCSLMLSAIILVSCVSTVPSARIGDYISSGCQAGDDAFARIGQRPLQAGFVVVSDAAELGVDPNLPEAALIRLGESLQRDLGHVISLAITEMIPAGHIKP